mmetsp:Transcript_70180/g.219016  ORF Transcript_70180/g.219016 Transcript_70180/m.219016 type:complete len:298 (+) Transcript_70180:1441-2334(+)
MPLGPLPHALGRLPLLRVPVHLHGPVRLHRRVPSLLLRVHRLPRRPGHELRCVRVQADLGRARPLACGRPGSARTAPLHLACAAPGATNSACRPCASSLLAWPSSAGAGCPGPSGRLGVGCSIPRALWVGPTLLRITPLLWMAGQQLALRLPSSEGPLEAIAAVLPVLHALGGVHAARRHRHAPSGLLRGRLPLLQHRLLVRRCPGPLLGCGHAGGCPARIHRRWARCGVRRLWSVGLLAVGLLAVGGLLAVVRLLAVGPIGRLLTAVGGTVRGTAIPLLGSAIGPLDHPGASSGPH